MNLFARMLKPAGAVCALTLLLFLAGCPPESPIAKDVFTTAEQQILPVGLPADTPRIWARDVALYEESGYSAWHIGPGTNYSSDPAKTQPVLLSAT